MFDSDALLANTDSLPVQKPKQWHMIVVRLALVFVVLGLVLYGARDFWLHRAQDAAGQSQQAAVPSTAGTGQLQVAKKGHNSKSQPKDLAPDAVGVVSPGMFSGERTVLTPPDVEVTTANVHRIVRPRTNYGRVDLDLNAPLQGFSGSSSANGAAGETAASVTSNAAEHVQMSTDAAEIVGLSVTPADALRARQMKVEGSVILQALINRDGTIQNLDVVSGSAVLAGAAKEAVKQFHFKPHYPGADAAARKAKITVNFTISTN